MGSLDGDDLSEFNLIVTTCNVLWFLLKDVCVCVSVCVSEKVRKRENMLIH